MLETLCGQYFSFTFEGKVKETLYRGLIFLISIQWVIKGYKQLSIMSYEMFEKIPAKVQDNFLNNFLKRLFETISRFRITNYHNYFR